MNSEEFMKHSFFEGVSWDRMLRLEIWEDFVALNRAFSRGREDDNDSPSPSPSAEKDTSGLFKLSGNNWLFGKKARESVGNSFEVSPDRFENRPKWDFTHQNDLLCVSHVVSFES